MRLLAVNPNTTPAVTERFVAEARLSAPAGTVIDGVTGTFGAAIVSTRAEAVVAAHAALDLLARHGDGYDAAILAISFDTGLDAARDVMACPVVGITQAALDAACVESSPIGLVTFGTVSLPLYRDLVTRYGLAGRVAGIEVVEVDSAAGYLDPAALDEAVLRAVAVLAEAGARSVVICGAAIVGIARRLQPRAGVPLFDGAAPAVAQALEAVAKGLHVSPLRPLGSSTGLGAALTGLIEGRGPLPAAERFPST